MAISDFTVRLKKEAKSSLQIFKDQSLLRRKFGDSAVQLYDSIDSKRTAANLMESLGLTEEQFVAILEFMNNNGMVSMEEPEQPMAGVAPPPIPSQNSGGSGEEGEGETEEGEGSGAGEGKITPPVKPKPKIDANLLSPLEKVLYEKYGELGVRIYNLIDGEKTAEEIMRETSVSEAKLVEVLEFMDEEGIIKLEKPTAAGSKESESVEEEVSAREEKKGDSSQTAREPRFKPMIEEDPEETPFIPPKPPKKDADKKEEKKQVEISEDIVMIDVPSLSKLSLMQKAVLFAELSTKFGKGTKELMNSVDGNRDFIELSLATGLSFFDIDAIMAYFGQKGFLSFRQLGRDEIKKRYGEDGFAIYKRFGRDGVLIYEMIGKEASLKDIIVKSKLDADRAIDIFIFIHKVLGLDIPIDKNVIYRQLGMKK